MYSNIFGCSLFRQIMTFFVGIGKTLQICIHVNITALKFIQTVQERGEGEEIDLSLSRGWLLDMTVKL